MSKKPASSRSRIYSGVCTHSDDSNSAKGRLAWQVVCATLSYYLTEGWPVWLGHANARPPQGPAKSCGGRLAGCRCNIDDTAECSVDYCCMRRGCSIAAVSDKKYW